MVNSNVIMMCNLYIKYSSTEGHKFCINLVYDTFWCVTSVLTSTPATPPSAHLHSPSCTSSISSVMSTLPSCTSFHFSRPQSHAPVSHPSYTPPVSGLVATRTKFMPETASSAIHSLFPGFRLLVISLYDFLVYWLLSQQDSLSIAFHISESRASWIPRLRFPEFRASWIPRLHFQSPCSRPQVFRDIVVHLSAVYFSSALSRLLARVRLCCLFVCS